jgi:type III pantothenate kinase
MRILAIDMGNTRLKWACSQRGDQSGVWLQQGAISIQELAGLTAQWQGLPSIDQVVVANVAGGARRAELAGYLAGFACTPWWVQSQNIQCGVRNAYLEPSSLGVDRWAALIGARQLCRQACLVVNIGTTMTVDALLANGDFIGGCIVPGPRLMRDVLDRDTAQLSARDGTWQAFPTSTGDAIWSGVVNALVGAVQVMVQQLQGQLVSTGASPAVQIVLAGGAASWVLGPLETLAPVIVSEPLVLLGLTQMAFERTN